MEVSEPDMQTLSLGGTNNAITVTESSDDARPVWQLALIGGLLAIIVLLVFILCYMKCNMGKKVNDDEAAISKFVEMETPREQVPPLPHQAIPVHVQQGN